MTPLRPPVSVIGLGAMGRALAAAFLAAGHPTTVWNRTPGRAGALIARGAREVVDIAEAVPPGALTVVCLLDGAAVEAVADTVDEARGWRGAAVVNLTSSTPDDARSLAERFTGAGAGYLDGTIMVTTGMIGTAESHVLYSGDRDVYLRHRATLDALGGSGEFLGGDPGLAATYDLGMLDIFFSGMASFLHAAALVGRDGITGTAFLPYARRVLAVLDTTLDGLADDVDSGRHDGSEDNLVMELAFLDHILATTRRRGLDPALPEAVHALVGEAVRRGHGNDSFSRVVDVVREPVAPLAGR